jgi:hypothetical protein
MNPAAHGHCWANLGRTTQYYTTCKHIYTVGSTFIVSFLDMDRNKVWGACAVLPLLTACLFNPCQQLASNLDTTVLRNIQRSPVQPSVVILAIKELDFFKCVRTWEVATNIRVHR